MKKTGMSVAAGVILIILAVFNVIGGLGGLACGGAVGAMSGAADGLDSALTENMSDEEKAQFKKTMAEATSAANTGAGMIMAFGLLTLVFGVLNIVCAVGVFGLKAWAINLTLGVMGASILFSVISGAMTAFGIMTIVFIALYGFVGYAVFASKDDGGAAPMAPAAPAAGAPPPAE